MTTRRLRDPALLAPLTAAIWLAAGCALLALVLMRSVPEAARAGCFALIGIAWAGALGWWLGRDAPSDRMFRTGQYLGYAAMLSLVLLTGDPHTAFGLFYLWLVVHAAYFDTLRHAIAQAVFAAAAYALALALVADTGFPVVQWTMVVATMLAVSALIVTLRRRVTLLVDRLNRLAETDELTGLGNRRRLMGELARLAERATPAAPATVALFDLDGFKGYTSASSGCPPASSTATPRSTRGSASSSAATCRSASACSTRRRRCAAWRPWCGRRRSTTTATASRTGPRARRSRCSPGSSRSAPRTSRSTSAAATRRRSSAARPAPGSTRRWSTPS